MAVGAESPVEHPLGLVFLAGDEPDDVLVQALRDRLHLDVGDEAVFVLLLRHLLLDDRLGYHGNASRFREAE